MNDLWFLICFSVDEVVFFVIGIWLIENLDNGIEIFILEMDEVKFIIKGICMWKNVDMGESFYVGLGSVVWFFKGLRNIIVSVKNFVIFYVEVVVCDIVIF